VTTGESLRGGVEGVGLRMVSPSRVHFDSFRDMVAEFHSAGENWPHGAQSHDRRALDDFDAYVRECEDHARGLNLPEGKVPCSVFWLVAGNRVVGTVSFRHVLNERLTREGGHIGYCIRPSDRRKGLMTRFLKMALEAVGRKGLSKVLITCEKANLASVGVIRTCGGVLEDEHPSEYHPGQVCQRYWITL